MSNDMQPAKPAFDYQLVSQEQAMQLKEIAIRLGVRVQRTAEEMLAMGADLREAKKVCKEDGTLFTAWCESAECPVGYQTATRLMSIHAELGDKNITHYISSVAYNVLSTATMTREEDIRQALLEHIEKESEDGNKVSQKEITALKKALKDAQAKAKELEDQSFDARAELEKLKIEKKKLAEREEEARHKKSEYSQMLLDADKQRKALEKEYQAKLKDQRAALQDAEEVHREHLQEMRAKITEEERSRPRTDAEEAAHQAKLKELQDAANQAQTALNQSMKEKSRLESELIDMRKEVALRDRVLNDWGTASIAFREVALKLVGSTKALRDISMTDQLYSQVKMIRELAQDIITSLDDATHVG